MIKLISIVVTIYNRERYLAKTISSILKQTRGDFELLLWDDGSSDRSVEIARSYAKKDRRIKVVAATHMGRGLALFKAIEQTKGKYLAWVDSDDLLQPQALELTAKFMEQNIEVGMVYTDCLLIDERGKTLGLDKRTQVPYSKKRLLVDFMTFHFRLIRRCAYDRIGGVRAEFGTVEDYDLCLRLSEVSLIKHLPQPLYKYRVHQDSICGTQQIKQIQLTQKIIEEALMRRGLHKEMELEVKLQPQFILRRKKS